jgi:hypothetical protein
VHSGFGFWIANLIATVLRRISNVTSVDMMLGRLTRAKGEDCRFDAALAVGSRLNEYFQGTPNEKESHCDKIGCHVNRKNGP